MSKNNYSECQVINCRTFEGDLLSQPSCNTNMKLGLLLWSIFGLKVATSQKKTILVQNRELELPLKGRLIIIFY